MLNFFRHLQGFELSVCRGGGGGGGGGSCICLSLLLLVFCRVAVVKRLPIHHHNADYIFWFFRIIEFVYSLKPELGAMTLYKGLR